jgi:hypothetical protein
MEDWGQDVIAVGIPDGDEVDALDGRSCRESLLDRRQHTRGQREHIQPVTVSLRALLDRGPAGRRRGRVALQHEAVDLRKAHHERQCAALEADGGRRCLVVFKRRLQRTEHSVLLTVQQRLPHAVKVALLRVADALAAGRLCRGILGGKVVGVPAGGAACGKPPEPDARARLGPPAPAHGAAIDRLGGRRRWTPGGREVLLVGKQEPVNQRPVDVELCLYLGHALLLTDLPLVRCDRRPP